MRQAWNIVVALNLDSKKTPVFLQIAQILSEAIQSGKLNPGEALPGTRAMSEILGVHRKTVVAAYDELAAQGWVQSESSKGTFVSPALPDTEGAHARPNAKGELPTHPDYSFQQFVEPIPYVSQCADVMTMNDGTPDPRLLPSESFLRSYRKVLQADKGRLNYGDPAGQWSLRSGLSDILNKARGLACKPEQILITRGSQMALYLVAQALIRSGDCVAIEELSYPPAWQALEYAGAIIEPIPLDEGGLCVEVLEALCQKRKKQGKSIRAIYLTPHHQYPTTVNLRARRRLKLLELAREYGFVIIEDDYDHDYHYSGHPVLPLASMDHSGQVLYIGSLSKLLAPGLRIGYIVGPDALIQSMSSLRMMIDRQGDPILEEAVADMIANGELKRHAKKARKHYMARRDAFATLMGERLGSLVSFTSPAGGLAFWIQFQCPIKADDFCQEARNHGLSLLSGKDYSYARKPVNAIRVGFASFAIPEMELLVDRLCNISRSIDLL